MRQPLRLEEHWRLQPALAPCPHCGEMVLTRLWHQSTRLTPPQWEDVGALSPLLGLQHVCAFFEKHGADK